MHPRCVAEKDYLGWTIPYSTASERKTYFPAGSVMLEVEGKSTCIAVGVSKHMTEDMLMGRDIPHFRQYLKKLRARSQKLKRKTPHLLPSAPSQEWWLPMPSNCSRKTSRRRSVYSRRGMGPSCLLSTRS